MLNTWGSAARALQAPGNGMSMTEHPEDFFQVVTVPAAHAPSSIRAIIRIYLVSTVNIAIRR